MAIKHRRLAGALAALAAVGLLLAIFAWLRKPPPSHDGPPELAQQQPWPPRVDRDRQGEAAAPAFEEEGKHAEVEPDQPLIDQLTVDKTEVCRGEENFLNVKARTSNGTDGFLAVHFQDPTTHRVMSGTRIPFRLEAPPERAMEVLVEGRGGAAKVGLVPHVEVKDCAVPRQIHVDVTRTAASPERVILAARVVERPPEKETGLAPSRPLEPTSFEWDFGDGTALTTNAPETEHSYEGRDQSVAQSYFVVTVKARDGVGNDISGSKALWFPNLGFLPLVRQNRVVVSVGVREADPAAGTPEQIWLYHGYSASVHIDRVTMHETVLDAPEQPERETMRREYRPEELLGFDELPPRQTRTTRDLTALQPSGDTAVRYVEVVGHTTDGRTASGTFTLLPPKQPLASN
jgi:hypothetical protein